jgi:microcystin degradation protein MlrC
MGRGHRIGRLGHRRKGSTLTRILIGGYMHEAHSFVPGTLDLEAMALAGYIAEGPAMLTTAIGDDHEVSGAIDVAAAAGVELIPTVHAWGGVGPPIEDDTYRFFEQRILAGARANRDRLDGVYLPLHGASVTTEREDPEGDLLTAVRVELGPEIPIVASFDLHAHTTDRMASAADVLIAYRTCPHTDFRPTGARAMGLLLDAVARRTRPVTRQRKLRLMASAEKQDTNHGPMVGVMELARAMEARPGILSVSVTATQPWLDLEELGWSAIVVADGDAALAQATADELAWTIWDRRESYRVVKVPVAEAVASALENPGRPVILADGADSPSAGGSGDGNDLLRELLRRGDASGSMLAIADPVAARAAVAAGVGATVTVALGGAYRPDFYEPLDVTATVTAVRDGRYDLELPIRPVDIGATAVLEVAGVRVVVSERKAFQLDESVYHMAGLDPRTARIVQAKSAGGFRGVYEAFAADIIEMDTPGPCTSDLTRLPFRTIPRPMWPWDPDLDEPWPGARATAPSAAAEAAAR